MELLNKNIKLKATSLLETLIASVIAAICFGVGLMIYTNMLTSNYSNLQSEISLFIDQQIHESISKKKFKSETVFLENISIEKKVSFYKNDEEIIELSFEAINQKGKTIYKKSVLKYVEK